MGVIHPRSCLLPGEERRNPGSASPFPAQTFPARIPATPVVQAWPWHREPLPACLPSQVELRHQPEPSLAAARGGSCDWSFSKGGNGISVSARATTPLHCSSTQETWHTLLPPCTNAEQEAPLGSGSRRSLHSDCLLGFRFSSLPLPQVFISSLGVAAAWLLFSNAPHRAWPCCAESLLAAQVI